MSHDNNYNDKSKLDNGMENGQVIKRVRYKLEAMATHAVLYQHQSKLFLV